MPRLFLFLLLLLAPAAAAAAPVLGPHQPLTRGFVEPLLGEALNQDGVAGSFELRIDAPRLPLMNQSAAATTITVEDLHHDADSGRFQALLVGRIAASVRFRLPASGRVVPLIEVPVLSRPVAPGERIRAADLDSVSMRASRLRPGAVTEPARLAGAEARRRLMPGRVLTTGDVREPQLVRRGRAVRVIYVRPGLRLSVLGTAEDDGALGEVVRVQNVDSRRRIQGVVIGPDEVRVGGDRRHDLPG